jgi:hypothetical protein
MQVKKLHTNLGQQLHSGTIRFGIASAFISSIALGVSGKVLAGIARGSFSLSKTLDSIQKQLEQVLLRHHLGQKNGTPEEVHQETAVSEEHPDTGKSEPGQSTPDALSQKTEVLVEESNDSTESKTPEVFFEPLEGLEDLPMPQQDLRPDSK